MPHAREVASYKFAGAKVFLPQALWPCSIPGSPCNGVHRWLEGLKVTVDGEVVGIYDKR